MLANILLADTLSILLGLSSLTFYIAAFFYPEVHRRFDPLWSGLGLFYAAILWFCASQLTLAILLSQLIAIALLIGLGWQTLSVRREKTPVYQQTPVVITPEVVGDWAKNKLNQLRIAPPEPVPLRLEKRSLSEFSSAKPDPRRRPVYEYEFVEDGISDEFPLAPVLDPQELALSAEDVSSMADLSYTAPPSAEAEVLSVESPEAVQEPEVQGLEIQKPEAQEPEGQKLEIQELEDQEPKVQESQLSEAPDIATLESVAKEKAVVMPLESLASEDLETEISNASETDNDWNDDIFAAAPPYVEPGRQKVFAEETLKKAASKPKPSLIAMPLILIGWLKDVATSLNKPKPSRPMIDIPRRQPSIPDKRSVPDERSVEFQEEILEESNWDD